MFAARIVAGVAAIGCVLAGLYRAFYEPTQGFILIGAGIVIGVVFGRVPGRANQRDMHLL